MLGNYDPAIATSTLTVVQTCNTTDNTSPVGCPGSFAGCGFPSDSQGIYYYLPADPSVVIFPSGPGGDHCSAGALMGGAIVAIQAVTNNPAPNGNRPLDAQISFASHETIEYITDPASPNGWRCSIGQGSETEIADLCQENWGGGPWLGHDAGEPYNLIVDGGSFYVTPFWQAAGATVYNGCYTQDPSLTGLGSLCPCPAPGGFQLACSGTWCTMPSCNDGQRDGFETDIDCGGTCPSYQVTGPLEPPNSGLCASGKRCQYYTDCASGTCSAGLCN